MSPSRTHSWASFDGEGSGAPSPAPMSSGGSGGSSSSLVSSDASLTPFIKDRVIDGKAVAKTIQGEIASEVSRLKDRYGRVPGLAVVIVGARKDSQTYVRMKKKACADVGIASFEKCLPDTVSQEELLKVVRDFNSDKSVHGILVQLPLPKHIDESAVLAEISIEKDVDGFHPLNIGRLCMKGREPLFIPCTPFGCMQLLERNNIKIKGANAVVVGRSNIVGLPAAMLLLKRDASVTIVHSATQDMASIVRRADIVIAAAGKTELIKKEWLKPGCVVIDVGTNGVEDKTKKTGYRLVGDVDFAGAKQVAAAVTPVPGGVGPMTIAMLLQNTLEGGKRDIEGTGSSSSSSSQPGWKKRAISLARTVAAAAVGAWLAGGRGK
ncbi:methenyltetrahydrofolate cyclohydrolase [Pseudoscourfieldia marina]